MTIPGGAFSDCEKIETPTLLRPDGKPATSFKARASALAAMREAAIAQEEINLDIDKRLAVLEAAASTNPFP
jgi:hypothetical protein